MDQTALIIFWFLVIYSLGGTIYHIVGSYRNLLKERAQLKENLNIAEASLAAAEDYAGDLESGYATMATTLETMQTELDDMHKWMDQTDAHMQEHCRQINQVAAIRIQIHPMQPNSMNYDYTGPDGYEEEPYSESTSPTLPLPVTEWVVGDELKGLDTL